MAPHALVGTCARLAIRGVHRGRGKTIESDSLGQTELKIFQQILLQLIGALDDYLNPPECDKILLKSYYQAIHSRILLPNTIPYIIAEHHVNAYKTKLNQRTGTVAEQRGNNDE